jgi:hypothetical protein
MWIAGIFLDLSLSSQRLTIGETAVYRASLGDP